MANEKTRRQVTGWEANGEQGYEAISAIEQQVAARRENEVGASVIAYECQDSDKLWEVTMKVLCPNAQDARGAEWAGKSVARRRHPSLWKETVMAFRTEQGWVANIRWNIWKNSPPKTTD